MSHHSESTNSCREQDLPIDKMKPRRPLSAYNFFFKEERQNILKQTANVPGKMKPARSHGKIGFASLARTVAKKWKTIDPSERKRFEQLAAKEKQRFIKEKQAWKKLKAKESKKKGKGQPKSMKQIFSRTFLSWCKEQLIA